MVTRSTCFSAALSILIAVMFLAGINAADNTGNAAAAKDTANAGESAGEKEDGKLALVPGGLLLKIGELCVAAQESFQPVDEADLANARKELLESIAVLEKRLAEDGVNGEAWKAYLKLDELKKQLDTEAAPDVSSLTKIQERFDSDNEGLNLIWFAEVRRALWRYQTIATAINNQKVKEGFDSLLNELPSRLKSRSS